MNESMITLEEIIRICDELSLTQASEPQLVNRLMTRREPRDKLGFNYIANTIARVDPVFTPLLSELTACKYTDFDLGRFADRFRSLSFVGRVVMWSQVTDHDLRLYEKDRNFIKWASACQKYFARAVLEAFGVDL